MSHTLTITGCGTSAYNAEYTYAGTQNARPYWSNGSTSYIYSLNNAFEGVNYWVLSDALTDNPGMFDNHSCYALQSDAKVPPKFGLVAMNGATAGDPVIAALQESVVVSGAGLTAANGRYVFADVYNSRSLLVLEGDAYHLEWNGSTSWLLRTGAVPTGTTKYTNTTDQDEVPTSGWTVSAGDSPAPNSFTTQIYTDVQNEIVQFDGITTLNNFAVTGGSGESVIDVINRAIYAPDAPAGDTPYIQSTTNNDELYITLAALANTPEAVYKFVFQGRGKDDGSSFGAYSDILLTAGGNNSGAGVLVDNQAAYGWDSARTFNATTNQGSISWPLSESDYSGMTVRLRHPGTAAATFTQLVTVKASYYYWANESGGAPELTNNVRRSRWY